MCRLQCVVSDTTCKRILEYFKPIATKRNCDFYYLNFFDEIYTSQQKTQRTIVNNVNRQRRNYIKIEF